MMNFEHHNSNKPYPNYKEISLDVKDTVSIRFSKETLRTLEQLGDVLRRIRRRMKSEGYDVIDGVLVKIENHEQPTDNIQI